ncbi:MAG: hypothetical protein GWO04_46635, partial [Actinobacteria bacterium]|nr:hypothetical protein [Actinomycetota bacterium]
HRIAYDLLGRDTLEVTTGPAMGSLPAQDVVVRKAYDPGGNPIRVARHSQPDTAQIGTITTEWRYDTAGRTVAEIAPDGARDSLVYDPAGNVVRKITRRGHTIRFVYDALGRLVRRVTPAVRYAQEVVPVDTDTLHFPTYPNDGVALLI